MKKTNAGIILTILISLVWLINGLFCKVLGLVPRHEMIVARIIGGEYSYIGTKVIGILEIMMFIWVISRKYSKFNAIVQITVVSIMIIIETILTPDLLLFGRFNIIFILIFIALIYYNEFVLNTGKPKLN